MAFCCLAQGACLLPSCGGSILTGTDCNSTRLLRFECRRIYPRLARLTCSCHYSIPRRPLCSFELFEPRMKCFNAINILSELYALSGNCLSVSKRFPPNLDHWALHGLMGRASSCCDEGTMFETNRFIKLGH